MKPSRAAIYTRISLDAAGDSASPERQQVLASQLCEQRGWTVERVFTDRSVSAYRKGLDRPALKDLLERARLGEFDVVVAYSVSRLSRSVLDFYKLVAELDELGVALVTVADQVDFTTAAGKLMTTMLAALAEMESALIGERMRSSHQVRAERGDFPAGPRRFGYTTKGEIVEDEAELLRQAADRVIEGATVRATARWLNEQGSKTTRGNDWTQPTLGSNLTDGRAAGYRQVDGELVRGSWEPILTERQFSRVCAAVADKWKPRTRNKRSLLAGLVHCGNCGARMYPATAGRRGQNLHVYACQKRQGSAACGSVAAMRDGVDAEVVRQLTEDVAWVVESENAAGQTSELEAELKAVEERMAELAAARFGTAAITNDEWLAAREVLVDQLERAEAALEVTRAADLGMDSVAGWWEQAADDERVDLLRHLVQEVTVNKSPKRGGRFRPERVKVVWRWGPMRKAAIDPDSLSAEERAEAHEEYLALGRESVPEA